MTGKISNAEKNIQTSGGKMNSLMGKISTTKSILSYQNGSAVKVENIECSNDETRSGEGFSEDASTIDETFQESQNLKSECLDLLRKKLISDLSLSVFTSDLENKLTKMDSIEISKERQSVVQKLIVQIGQLSDAEKLLLYLKLPSSTSSPFDPLRHSKIIRLLLTFYSDVNF
ncbi:hypothetical protein Phum_PHUM035270 [Pediculus humanus corporis]|uniref:Uncharacterized protein n=1 Tax=Pediculus humanus subsp. corporis TaxID=121224 RepID=E0VAD6_PEDHC|nr:uncharacterized protein Phum_PHUM035270 [Pediculus humanus corporis]EEB10342.1 hypothetical protein Phum_PHUM035270 [Pediculus humanus corporis]